MKKNFQNSCSRRQRRGFDVKVAIIFNEERRKKFLDGFHKRKVVRQKKAQEKLRQQLRLKKKMIKEDAQKNNKEIFAQQDSSFDSHHEYEISGRKISILELPINDERLITTNSIKKFSQDRDVKTKESND